MCKGKDLTECSHRSDRRSDPGASSRSGPRRREWAFTLVELLIVIAIIGILATLTLTAISAVRESTAAAITRTEVKSLDQAVEHYYQDEGVFPGQAQKGAETENQFPLLFNAIFGERAPRGPGGRNAPYMQLKEDNVVVYDEDIEAYRKASLKERRNTKIDKFIVDAWGNPLQYRANKARKVEDYRHNRYRFDVYSTGPDGIDQTIEGEEDENDDVGNW